jgi:hypothetical protein
MHQAVSACGHPIRPVSNEHVKLFTVRRAQVFYKTLIIANTVSSRIFGRSPYCLNGSPWTYGVRMTWLEQLHITANASAHIVELA